MSVNSLFEISQRSFRALNAKMDATGQNIANANTEGYSRRRATLEASNTVSPGLYTSPPGPATGDGATVSSYERMRDQMLDSAAAEAKTGESGAREEGRVLSVLEGALATDTEGSLTSSLENFFNGLNDLASNPTDQGVREAVLAKADTLTGAFDRLDQKIGGIVNDTESALASSVEEANGLLKEVASLNTKIQEARASGSPDLAAEDRRDQLVSTLSESMPVEVQEDAKNGYTLSVNGMNVVQGEETTLLQTKNLKSASSPTVEFGDTGVAFKPGDGDAGEIGAQLRLLNQTLPEVQGRLDGLAKDVVEDVNTIHKTGFDQNGDTGENFFVDKSATAAGNTAGNIELNVDGPKDIAAYGAAGEPGDTKPAQKMAALSETLTPKAIDLASSVGSKVQQAASREEANAATANRLESLAEGVSGVSLDEEMSNLVEQQQQFAATARVLRTAQEVTNTLLSI